jgi:tetratricopeptide (TPR) repeat protein
MLNEEKPQLKDEANINLPYAYAKQKCYSQAIREILRALSLDPNDRHA